MRILSALLLGVLSSVAYGQGIAGPVTVFVDSDRTIPAAVLDAMQREAEATVLSSQIRLSWQAGNPSAHPEVVHRLTVVRLRGECRPGAPLPVRLRTVDVEALGQTQTVNGAVLPIADVQCDSLRYYLDRELRAAPSSGQEDLLGRALGRVVAHELYHMLLRTRGHGRNGLARPMITRAELLQPRQTFAQPEEQRLAEAAGFDPSAADTGR